MDRTAIDGDSSWFEPDELELLRRKVPFPYIDVLPVRTDAHGRLTHLGLLLRATGESRIALSLISGRIRYHETIREAVVRHVEKDLGPLALPELPTSLVPFTVAEYFPTPGFGPFVDERQHAISLAYIVPITGHCEPQDDALDLSWYSVAEIQQPEVLAGMPHGHDLLVRRALAWAGVA
jgi:ADP-ribose pyrophosphatase YjhB (NUDIX family)